VTAIAPQSGSPYFAATPQKHFVYDSATVHGATMTNAAGRLADAYTCPSSPPTCSSRITDLGFSYSLRGEAAGVYQSSSHSGGYYHVTESYWENGLVHQLNVLNTSDPPVTGLPTWTYTPEGEGRAATVSAGSGQNPVTSVPNPAYNVFGLLNGLTFGSADSDAFTYDNNTGRMTQYQATITSSSAYGAMTWNTNGSLYSVAITDQFNSANKGTCNHTYDDLGRVSQVNCVNGNWGQNFTYDLFGNIKKSQFGTYTNGTFLPTYDLTTNRYSSFPSGPNPTYDANGNLTYDQFHHYAWDADGNLS